MLVAINFFNIKVYMFDLYENKKYKTDLMAYSKGSDLKNKICDFSKINPKNYKIRLFFGGAEILDEHKVYQHNIKDGYTIQIMKTKID